MHTNILTRSAPAARSARILRSALATVATLACAAPALAHPGHPSLSDGFGAGLAHPWSGLDHLLAMTLVGFAAARLGGRALWALPACFILLMCAGAAAAMFGYSPPFVEAGIIASLAGLGLLVAFAPRLPLAAALPLVGLFAVFHGAAHGLEAEHNTSFGLYVAGFATSTAALHGIGLLAGLGWMRMRNANLHPLTQVRAPQLARVRKAQLQQTRGPADRPRGK
ncbi:MAG TPA: HupE/UreJ family protein [Steroidobacteraceae bacterium]|jgi:urease accessory protein